MKIDTIGEAKTGIVGGSVRWPKSFCYSTGLGVGAFRQNSNRRLRGTGLFCDKDMWPLNSRDMYPMNYYV